MLSSYNLDLHTTATMLLAYHVDHCFHGQPTLMAEAYGRLNGLGPTDEQVRFLAEQFARHYALGAELLQAPSAVTVLGEAGTLEAALAIHEDPLAVRVNAVQVGLEPERWELVLVGG